jgi:hypothetical protein
VNISSLLRSFTKKFLRGSAPRRKPFRYQRPLEVEHLEKRDLFAVAVVPKILSVTTNPAATNPANPPSTAPTITVQFSEAMDAKEASTASNYLIFNSSGTQFTGFSVSYPATGNPTNTATLMFTSPLPAGAYTLLMRGDQIFESSDTFALSGPGQVVVANMGQFFSNTNDAAQPPVPGPSTVSTINVANNGSLNSPTSYPLNVNGVFPTSTPQPSMLVTVADFNGAVDQFGNPINDVAIVTSDPADNINKLDIYDGLGGTLGFPTTPTVELALPATAKAVALLAFSETSQVDPLANKRFGPDLAVTDADPGNGQVIVFTNQTKNGGPTSFGQGVAISLGKINSTVVTPVGLVAGDFQGDGNTDLAVACNTATKNGTYSIDILPGNGQGGFGAPVNILLDPTDKGHGVTAPTGIAAGLLVTNHPNTPDLVVVGDGLVGTVDAEGVEVLINGNSVGTGFQKWTFSEMGPDTQYWNVGLGQIDQPAASVVDDIVAVHTVSNKVGTQPVVDVFTNLGGVSGSFTAPTSITIPQVILPPTSAVHPVVTIADLSPAPAAQGVHTPTGNLDILLPYKDATGAINAFTVGTNTSSPGSPAFTFKNFQVDNAPLALTVGNGGATNLGAITVFENNVHVQGRNGVGTNGGDINGDGIPDVVTANLGLLGSNFTGLSFTVASGTGTGSFLDPFLPDPNFPPAPPATSTAGSTFTEAKFGTPPVNNPAPSAIAVGDLNGDGIPDYVTVDSGVSKSDLFANQVEVYLGIAPATPGGPVTYSAPVPVSIDEVDPVTGVIHGQDPISVTLADLNGNGLPDVVTANTGDNTITILPNLGVTKTGTVSFGAPIVLTVGQTPTQVIAGLFDSANGKKAVDLIVAHDGTGSSNTSSGVTVLINADGPQTTLTTPIGPGQLSIPVASTANLPSGNFFVQIDSEILLVTAVSNGMLTVKRGVNGSMAAIHLNGAVVQVITETSLAAAIDNMQTTIPVTSTQGLPTTGNFYIQVDSEIMLVTAVGNGTLTVTRGANGSPTATHKNGAGVQVLFQPEQEVASGNAATAVAAGDFNVDGNLDFVVTNSPAVGLGSVIIMQGNGQGQFTQAGAPFMVAADPVALAVADLNRDGYPDIVVGSQSPDPSTAISVLLNTVGDGFQPPIYTAMPNNTPINYLAVDDLPLSVITQLAQPVTSTTQTTINVQSTLGFPQAPGFRIKVDQEVMLVTAINGNNYTVTRGVDGTKAVTHALTAPVQSNDNPNPYPDLIVGSYPIPFTASLPVVDNLFTLTGIGDGTFANPQPYEAGGPPSPATVAVLSDQFINALTFFMGGTLISSNLIENGNFRIRDLNGEGGNLVGWQNTSILDSHGDWFTQTATSAGSFSPLSQTTVPAPDGLYQGMLDEPNVQTIPLQVQSPGGVVTNPNPGSSYNGSHFLYQDVTIPANATSANLSLRLTINTGPAVTKYSNGPSFAPLDYRTTQPDEQVRVDLMDPTASITATNSDTPGSVFQNFFLTDSSMKLNIGLPIPIDVPIDPSLFGKTVRLRIAAVNNVDLLVVGVDDVDLQVEYQDTGHLSNIPTLKNLSLRNPGVSGVATQSSTTLTAAINATQTSIAVASAAGFPSVPFQVQIESETLTVTAVTPSSSGAIFTVLRGTNGTSAASHSAGATVTLVISTSDPTLIGQVGDDGSVINIAYIAFDPNAPTNGVFSFTGANVFKTNYFDAQGNFAVTLPTLPAGLNTIGVRVQDFAGNTFDSQIQFTNASLNTGGWTAVGPGPVNVSDEANISYQTVTGTVTSVAADPTDPSGNTYILGALNGGLWRTTDGGNSWTPLTDNLSVTTTVGSQTTTTPISTPIGAIAFSPSHPNNVYAATGAGDALPDSRGSVGILVSTKSGALGSWSVLGTTNTIFANARITAMAVAKTPTASLAGDITATQTVIPVNLPASTATSFPTVTPFFILIDSEMMEVTQVTTTPSGTTFTVVRGFDKTNPSSHTNGTAITSPDIIYVAVASDPAINPATGLPYGPGVYRSLDGGIHWDNIFTLSSLTIPKTDPSGNTLSVPTNIGSVTSLVIDPRTPSNVTIGVGNIGLVANSNTGGVWKSTNANIPITQSSGVPVGPTWQPFLGGDNSAITNDTLPSDLRNALGTVNVGRVTVSEGYASPTTGPGANIATFYVLIGNPSGVAPLAPQVSGGSVDYGNGIQGAGLAAGLYKSEDVGLDWTKVMLKANTAAPGKAPNFVNINLLGDDANNVGQLVLDPTDVNVVYVGGADNQNPNTPNPTNPAFGLIRVDTGNMRDYNWYIATKNNPNLATPVTGTAAADATNDGDDLGKIAAALHAPTKNTYPLGGAYGGEGVSWYDLESNAFSPDFGQLSPTNTEPEPVVPGARQSGFQAFSVSTLSRFPAEINSLVVDPDGRLVFGTQEGIWRAVYHGVGYDYTSGGSGIVAETNQAGSPGIPTIAITTINGNLQIANLTSVASDPNFQGQFYASSYDIGTMRTTGGLNWETMGINNAQPATSGGTPAVSPTTNDAGVVLVATPDPTAPPGVPSTIYREFAYTQKGSGYYPQSNTASGALGFWLPAKSNGISPNNSAGYFPVLVIDPTKLLLPGTPLSPPVYKDLLLFGTDRIWESTSSGNRWDDKVGKALSTMGGVMTAAAVAPSNIGDLYAGDNLGEIFFTLNNGATWSINAAPSAIASLGTPVPVTGLSVDPNTPNLVYATFGGVGSYSHVWRGVANANGTITWTSIQGTGKGALPAGVPAYSIVTDPVPSGGAPHGHLYLGTEVGVFVSVDQGNTWQRFNLGMPNVPVVNLEFNPQLNQLTAATQGRGAFVISTDYVGAHVVSETPATPVSPGQTTATVTFNKAIFSFPISSVTVTAPDGTNIPVQSVTNISVTPPGKSNPATTWQITFQTSLTTDGTYTVKVGPDVFDLVGNAMDQDMDNINGEVAVAPTGDAFSFPIVVNSTDDGQFISGLYHDLLGITAPTAGFLTYLNLIDPARYASLLNVAEQFITSTTGRTQLIDELYTSSATPLSPFGIGNLIGQLPSQQQLTTDLNFLAQGVQFESIIGLTVSSDQYLNLSQTGGTDAGFVNQVWTDLLGAPPADPTPYLTTLSNAERNARYQQMLSAVNGSLGLANFVEDIYALYIGGTPTTGQLNTWVPGLQNGTITGKQLIQAFVDAHNGPGTFAANPNMYLGQFVTFAYNAILPQHNNGQGPTQTDLNNALTAFALGFPVQDIVASLLAGTEYFLYRTSQDGVSTLNAQDQDWYPQAYTLATGQTPLDTTTPLTALDKAEITARFNLVGSQITSTQTWRNLIITNLYNNLLGQPPTTQQMTSANNILKLPSQGAGKPSDDELLLATILASPSYFLLPSNTDSNGLHTNEVWVNSLYPVLGLPFDSTGAATNLTKVLNGYAAQRSAVINSILHSAAYYDVIINADFQKYLRRAPSATERGIWHSLFSQGVSREVEIADLISSPDYFNRVVPLVLNLSPGTKVTNAQFVQVMVADLFPWVNAATLPESTWTKQLNAGITTRQALTTALTTGPVFIRSIVDTTHGVVNAIYNKFLGQNAPAGSATLNGFPEYTGVFNGDANLILTLLSTQQYFLEPHIFP